MFVFLLIYMRVTSLKADLKLVWYWLFADCKNEQSYHLILAVGRGTPSRVSLKLCKLVPNGFVTYSSFTVGYLTDNVLVY